MSIFLTEVKQDIKSIFIFNNFVSLLRLNINILVQYWTPFTVICITAFHLQATTTKQSEKFRIYFIRNIITLLLLHWMYFYFTFTFSDGVNRLSTCSVLVLEQKYSENISQIMIPRIICKKFCYFSFFVCLALSKFFCSAFRKIPQAMVHHCPRMIFFSKSLSRLSQFFSIIVGNKQNSLIRNTWLKTIAFVKLHAISSIFCSAG